MVIFAIIIAILAFMLIGLPYMLIRLTKAESKPIRKPEYRFFGVEKFGLIVIFILIGISALLVYFSNPLFIFPVMLVLGVTGWRKQLERWKNNSQN